MSWMPDSYRHIPELMWHDFKSDLCHGCLIATYIPELMWHDFKYDLFHGCPIATYIPELIMWHDFKYDIWHWMLDSCIHTWTNVTWLQVWSMSMSWMPDSLLTYILELMWHDFKYDLCGGCLIATYIPELMWHDFQYDLCALDAW